MVITTVALGVRLLVTDRIVLSIDVTYIYIYP